MSTVFIGNILSSELTAMPSWIKSVLGDNYNNALCNGATWTLVLWKILNLAYTKLMHRSLKKLGTKQYIRTRLTDSLWFCGFFSSVLSYYLVTLDANRLDLLQGNYVIVNVDVPTQVTVVFTVICTFYIHSAFSEGIGKGSFHLFLKYLLLATVCILAYIQRFLEIPFTLSALIAIPAVSEELTKIFYTMLSRDKNLNNIILRIVLACNLILFSFVHLMIIPLIFIVPLVKRIIMEKSNFMLIALLLLLLLWLGAAIFKSILFKSIYHWIYHVEEKEELDEEEESLVEQKKSKQRIECPGSFIECSLFPVRTDDAYVLQVLRSEVMERKMRIDALKKPKARNMLIQTLKCMMLIKKKLKQKYESENSDSDDHSEPDDETEDCRETEYQRAVEDEDEENDEAEVRSEDFEVDNKLISEERDDETAIYIKESDLEDEKTVVGELANKYLVTVLPPEYAPNEGDNINEGKINEVPTETAGLLNAEENIPVSETSKLHGEGTDEVNKVVDDNESTVGEDCSAIRTSKANVLKGAK